MGKKNCHHKKLMREKEHKKNVYPGQQNPKYATVYNISE